MAPKLKSISVSGFKSLGNVTLPFDGLSVLIGDNGSGKSSILEVLEILRSAAHENFVSRFASIHGGLHQLREQGARETQISVTIDDGRPEPVHYVLGWGSDSPVPTDGVVRAGNEPLDQRMIATREATATEAITKHGSFPIPRSETVVFAGSQHHPTISAVANVLRGSRFIFHSMSQRRGQTKKGRLQEGSASLSQRGVSIASASTSSTPTSGSSITVAWVSCEPMAS